MAAPAHQLTSTCPACSRYIGPHQECPYCGLESPHRTLHRALRLTAITLSVAGLALLLLIGQPVSYTHLTLPTNREV